MDLDDIREISMSSVHHSTAASPNDLFYPVDGPGRSLSPHSCPTVPETNGRRKVLGPFSSIEVAANGYERATVFKSYLTDYRCAL